MSDKAIAVNRKARHDYAILESFEAGIVLTGTEVKSMRAGKVNLKESYARIQNDELFVMHMHISPYEQGNVFNVDPMRDRKLLMHKHQIQKLYSVVKQDGLSLVVLKLYFKRGKVKAEIGLGKGKKLHDKRQDIAKREAEREIGRSMKQ